MPSYEEEMERAEHEAEMDAKAKYEESIDGESMAQQDIRKLNTIQHLHEDIKQILKVTIALPWIKRLQEDMDSSIVSEIDGYIYNSPQCITLLKHIFEITDKDIKEFQNGNRKQNKTD